MIALDLARLSEPIAADEPCGPDLDLAGDTAYFQCMSHVEGLMPSSYFTRDDEGRQVAFDRSKIDFAAEYRGLESLLDRTRDLRIVVMLGRLTALNRDLEGFTATISGAAALLSQYWDEVHPRGEAGDFNLRAAVLQALDEMATVILPLQHVPLAQTRRSGPISFRSIMVANGEAQPRDDDPVLDKAGVERVFAEADLAAMQATRDRFGAVQAAAGLIQTTSIERAGYEQSVSFERLPALVGRILAAIEPAIRARDPGAAGVQPAAPGTAPAPDPAVAPATAGHVGEIGGMPEVVRALAAVSAYLQVSMPSSPATLLVRQAESLIGKSFLDVIRTLVPTHVEQATISLGGDRLFELSYQQLSEISYPAGDVRPGSGVVKTKDARGPERQPFSASSRAEALALMQRVGSFYRAAEPSSPIPLLLDRASGMIERDFLALLKDVLPALSGRRSDD